MRSARRSKSEDCSMSSANTRSNPTCSEQPKEKEKDVHRSKSDCSAQMPSKKDESEEKTEDISSLKLDTDISSLQLEDLVSGNSDEKEEDISSLIVDETEGAQSIPSSRSGTPSHSSNHIVNKTFNEHVSQGNWSDVDGFSDHKHTEQEHNVNSTGVAEKIGQTVSTAIAVCPTAPVSTTTTSPAADLHGDQGENKETPILEGTFDERQKLDEEEITKLEEGQIRDSEEEESVSITDVVDDRKKEKTDKKPAPEAVDSLNGNDTILDDDSEDKEIERREEVFDYDYPEDEVIQDYQRKKYATAGVKQTTEQAKRGWHGPDCLGECCKKFSQNDEPLPKRTRLEDVPDLSFESPMFRRNSFMDLETTSEGDQTLGSPHLRAVQLSSVTVDDTPSSLLMSGGEDEELSDDDTQVEENASESEEAEENKKKRRSTRFDQQTWDEMMEKINDCLKGFTTVPKTLMLVDVLKTNPRGEVLRRSSSKTLEEINNLIAGTDICAINELLSSPWHFIINESEENEKTPTKFLVIDGNSRLRTFLQSLTDSEILATSILSLCTVVDGELFDAIWDNAAELDKDPTNAPMTFPEKSAAMLSFLFTMIESRKRSVTFSFYEKFAITVRAIDGIMNAAQRRNVKDKNIQTASRALVSTNVVPKSLEWAVQLSFAQPKTLEASANFIKQNLKFPRTMHLPVLIAKVSRTDDQKVADLIIAHEKGEELYMDLKKLLGEAGAEEKKPDQRGAGLSRTESMKELVVHAPVTVPTIPEKSILLILEDECDLQEMFKWMTFFDEVDAIVMVGSGDPFALGEFANKMNQLSEIQPNNRCTILQVKKDPRPVWIFSKDATFCSSVKKNSEKLEDVLAKEMQKRPNGKILRPKGPPPIQT